MKTSFDIEVSGAGDIRGYLLYRGVPIVLAGILMLWISGGGGFVPPTWAQLFYICAHLGVLLASPSRGIATLSLSLLVIQSIMLIVAWIVYIRLVMNAVATLREIIAQLEQSQALTLAALSKEQLIVQRMEEQARQTMGRQQAVVAPAVHAATYAQPTIRMQPGNNGQESNPFRHDVFLLDQTNAARPVQPPAQQQVSTQAQYSMTDKPIYKAAEPRDSTSQSPNAMPASVFDAIPNNPFEAEQAASSKVKKPAQKNAPSKLDAPPEFIFGNPFEGQLPDVFKDDEDLKRAMDEYHPYPRS